MPTLTDYQTFQDTTRREALRFRFHLPSNLAAGTARAIPVLMFRLATSQDCNCWVHVNAHADNPTASNAALDLPVAASSGHRTIHELLRAPGFQPGQENQLLIHKAPDATRGQFFVSDVVLMYQIQA